MIFSSGLVFLFEFFWKILSQTSFVPSQINSFSSVMLPVEIFGNKFLCFSVLH